MSDQLKYCCISPARYVQLAAAEKELETLKEERDEWKETAEARDTLLDEAIKSMEELEADVERLQRTVEMYKSSADSYRDCADRRLNITSQLISQIEERDEKLNAILELVNER